MLYEKSFTLNIRLTKSSRLHYLRLGDMKTSAGNMAGLKGFTWLHISEVCRADVFIHGPVNIGHRFKVGRFAGPKFKTGTSHNTRYIYKYEIYKYASEISTCLEMLEKPISNDIYVLLHTSKMVFNHNQIMI